MDIFFRLAYNQMGLLPTILKSVDTPFYNFFSHSIRPFGEVELLVIASNYPTEATFLTNFLIVDTFEVYNAIIERPTPCRWSPLHTIWH